MRDYCQTSRRYFNRECCGFYKMVECMNTKETKCVDQFLNKVHFYKLKGLNGLNISFGNKRVTALFGVNGCGKSTILHALACLYRPCTVYGEQNYFTRFFKRENKVTWSDSNLVADFTIDGKDKSIKYKKGERWTPRMNKRPQRDVVYIGIDSCVPDIEQASLTISNYNMGSEESLSSEEKIIPSASKIMNYVYSGYKKVTFGKKKYKRVSKNNKIYYSSLAMGAGEQRLFTILETLYSMQPYSMLLIDELDLTLHTSALNKLVDEMIDVANKRNMQIVFTTHREELASREDINIRHIWNDSDGNSHVLDRTTPDCLQRLTGGKIEQQLEIYVEDDLAESITREVLREKCLLPYTHLVRFGAVENAFVVAAGLEIQGADLENKIILMDGDRYLTQEERDQQMKKYYSGTENDKEERRKRALSLIKQYNIPVGEQPEHFLWEKLKATDNNSLVGYAKEIVGVEDKHSYLYDVQRRSGEERGDFLFQLTTILAKQAFWSEYVKELSDWLDARKAALGL